ncbi:MAG: ABC transporter substrate-binding protein [Chloroflexaceae bacterium]|jgi:branched-chain amino acid transport system substrate-binding protein|nr:ABC transporter substrate-binding protein [Chloroflexaceae bacterium]
MKRRGFHLGLLLVVMSVVLAACGAAAPQTSAPQGNAPQGSAASGEEIKIGVILPYTGVAAAAGKSIEQGIKTAVNEVGGQINGRQITLLFEDETDNPQTAVAKARKLVEQDQVAALIGPQLAHTAAAVGAYAAQSGVPHIGLGASGRPTSDHTFFPGSGKGDAYPTGLFAYEELGARKAAILYMDYLFGQTLRDGFKEAFTGKGGEVVAEKAIPLGTADVAPFLEGVTSADLLAVFLTAPSDLSFVRQYQQLGLKQPVIFISNAPQEEPLLQQMGDAAVGMYGSSYYSPQIDTPANKTFVEQYQAAFNMRPGAATQVAYLGARLYLQALQATNGDPSRDKITAALTGIKDMAHPAGTVSVGEGRVLTHDQWIFKVEKVGDRFVWQPVKQYAAVSPK